MPSLSDLPRLPFRQWFPWLELFRAGGLAVGWPQFGISFLAVVVLWIGTSLLGWWFPRETPEIHTTRLIHVVRLENASPDADINSMTKLLIRPSNWTEVLDTIPVTALLVPWNSVISPLADLVWRQDPVFGLRLPRKSPLAVFLNLAFAVSVWSLFGVAVCRAVAVQTAKDRSESLPNAARYAAARWLPAISAPSIPAGAILAVVITLVIAAWFGRIPFLGGPLLLLATPVLFLAGVVVAVLALVLIFGWPLMVAAIGVDDCDGFGALSRAYSFVMGRPAYAVWLAFVSLVYGTLLVALVGGVFTLALLAQSKPIAANVGSSDKWEALLEGSHFSAQLLLAAFAVSLFWSLVTWNYLLLRQAVDRKPFEDIASGGDEAFHSGLPVAGVPATDYRPHSRDGQTGVADAEAVVPAT